MSVKNEKRNSARGLPLSESVTPKRYLSGHTQSKLKGVGLKTFGDVEDMSLGELIRIPKVGRRSIDEILVYLGIIERSQTDPFVDAVRVIAKCGYRIQKVEE